jgi:hypothetical protein
MMNDVKTTQVEELQNQIIGLLEQVKLLTEQNLLLRQQLFGRSSERKLEIIPDGQLSLFNEAEVESDIAAPEPELEQITYKRKKQKGKRELDFAGLPTQKIIHEL